MVGVTGFEPATPWSQTRCATKLRHTPIMVAGARIELALEAYEASEATTPPSCRMASSIGFEPIFAGPHPAVLSR